MEKGNANILNGFFLQLIIEWSALSHNNLGATKGMEVIWRFSLCLWKELAQC